MLRADLHVHTWHSGYNHDLPFLKSRDCYAYPLAVYQAAKRRGMDLVAITDHDSIDGGLELLSRAPDDRDVILGEEISCWLPVDGATGSQHETSSPRIMSRSSGARLNSSSPPSMLS